GRGEVPEAQLAHAGFGGDPLEVRPVEPHRGDAVHHRDRRRYGTGLPDDVLELHGHLEVARPGEAVGDDRGLEGHDRTAGGERVGDLSGYAHNSPVRYSGY